MDLNKWYDKGLEPEEYMEALDKHKESFFHIYNEFTIPEDNEFLQMLKERNLRVIALAEVWCGHCMLDIPILLRLAENVSMPVRFLPRDENLELMDQYLTNGKSRSVPIFIFIDEDGNQVAKWGPIADSVKEFTNNFREQLPAKDSPEYEEAFKKLIAITGDAFRNTPQFWEDVYTSIKQAL